MNADFPRTQKLIEAALARREGSALAILVEGQGKRLELFRGLSAHPGTTGVSRDVNDTSLFDLASLTKALATVPLIAEALGRKLFAIDDPVRKFFPGFGSSEVNLRHLLSHNSGLKNHEEFYRRPEALEKGFVTKKEMEGWILASPLTPLAKAEVVYSDLGIMLLGFLLEKTLGASVAELFQEMIARPLGLKRTGFRTLPHASPEERALRLPGDTSEFVATAQCEFHGRLLQGEVDDNNCWTLGGATSHAGLFSTLGETLVLLRNAGEAGRRFPDIFLARPGSKPPFTAGFMLYPGLRPVAGQEWKGAIGHTGFVGTSAWIDPKSDSALVCLGNRVHPDRKDSRFIETRLEIQRAAWEELR